MTNRVPLNVNVHPLPVRGSLLRLVILIALIAGGLVFAGWCIESGSQEDAEQQAGVFEEVQLITGSANLTVRITVSGFRAGSIDDLSGFNVPPGERDNIPYYVWFSAKLTSGSYNPRDLFPITAGQWSAVSSAGTTLRGVRLGGELQPCPQINTERFSTGAPAEGCFMVFNETGQNLAEASLNLDGREISRWRFRPNIRPNA